MVGQRHINLNTRVRFKKVSDDRNQTTFGKRERHGDAEQPLHIAFWPDSGLRLINRGQCARCRFVKGAAFIGECE